MLESKPDHESTQSAYFGLEIAQTPELGNAVKHAKEFMATVENDGPVTVGQVHKLEESIKGLTVDVEGEKYLIEDLKSLQKEDVGIWQEIKNGNADNIEQLTFCPRNILKQIIQVKTEKDDSVCVKLNLNGLKSISCEAVKELLSVGKPFDVNLNGLDDLPSETAEILGKKCGYISLNGLTSLSPEIARHIGKIQNKTFNGLREISPEAGEYLSVLNNYTYVVKKLELNSLVTLSAATAKAFAKSNSPLELNGLSALDADAAKELILHENRISLNGLLEVNSETAKILAQFTFQLDVPHSIELIIDQYKPKWRQRFGKESK